MTEPTTIGVSIPIPSPHGEYLQERRAAFGDPSAWGIPAHITLLPPTPVEDGVCEDFLAHCKQVASERDSFEVVLRGTGTFRPISDVVYIQVAQGVSACERLEKHLSEKRPDLLPKAADYDQVLRARLDGHAEMAMGK